MTTIKKIITSVLRDVVQAQYEANAYARDLTSSDLHRVNIPIIPPTVGIGELTLNLRFAIGEGEDVSEVRVLDKRENDRILESISEQLAKLMIRKFVHQVQQSKIAYHNHGFSYIEDLGDNRRLIDYLTYHMHTALKNNVQKLYTPKNELDVEAIADQVLAVGEQYLFHHSDIEGLFTLSGGQALLRETRHILDNEVSEEISKIIKEEQATSLYHLQTNHSLCIETEAEKLKEYPSETIQTLSLTVISRQDQETDMSRQ